eukprot:3928928-Pyramimonas_sp.AAC.1
MVTLMVTRMVTLSPPPLWAVTREVTIRAHHPRRDFRRKRFATRVGRTPTCDVIVTPPSHLSPRSDDGGPRAVLPPTGARGGQPGPLPPPLRPPPPPLEAPAQVPPAQ